MTLRIEHLALALLAFGACGDDDADDTGKVGPADVAAVTEVDAVVSDVIGTVVTVTWTTDSAATTYIEFGNDGEYGLSTPVETEATTDHSAVLVGLHTNTDAVYRVVVVDEEGTEWPQDEQTVTTGSAPVELPSLTVTGSGNDHYMVLPIISPGLFTGPVIISPEGEYVWWWSDHRDLDVYRAKLSVDGETLLYNAASVSGDPAANSELVRISLDGTEETTIPVPLLAHDFVEHPDGTIGTLAVEYRDMDDVEVRGDQIVEIAPDGTQTVVWSAWNCFDPAEVGDPIGPEGWTFANALDYDPDTEMYYLGMRGFSSIAKIDRATGSCQWVFGGEAGTIDIAAGSSIFLHQHQFEVLGDTFLVFDNDGATATESRVLEYAFDEQAGTAEEIWSYTANPPVFTFVLGDVARLDDGNTLVDWSVVGQMELVTPAGESIWQLNTQIGAAFGFNTPMADLYVGR